MVEMLLVADRDGVLEVNWSWLPFWLAINPYVKTILEVELKEFSLQNQMTNAEGDMLRLHTFLVRRIAETFPDHKGLDLYLSAISFVHWDDTP